METTTSKRAPSTAEQAFDVLLRDSLTEVFTGVLGKTAGQALLDVVKSHTSLETKDLPGRPDLVDQALMKHLGLCAKVLERKILRTLAWKTAGVAPGETDRFDFASEVEKARIKFLKRKQAGNRPNTLE